ncbi:MAG TPA: tRNA 2-thiouridine(34) synthase MnmA [Nitrospirae bacterium]|nr:tRNA 2-thiouridine(34) synthase MnmA [Nitrospirota bacterium]
MSKVIVAMSGGVDSTMTAYLLKKQGYDVVGVSFIFYEDVSNNYLNSIKQNLEIIKISHYFVDLRKSFEELIINPFYNAYKSGITPNPCVFCNRIMKFHNLLKEADRIGADYISTGHYAIINNGMLYRGKDPLKDQSYSLYRLSLSQLKKVILPLGYYHKSEIKDMASNLGLPCAKQSESQEVCFLGGRGYHTFIKEYKEGNIINIHTNQKIGIHKGFFRYTIGQRRRIEASSQVPLYVVDIDAEKNIIYVGNRELATSDTIKVSDINWIDKKEQNFQATVKIRSTMKDQPAWVEFINQDELIIKFQEPQWAPAGGQSAVFYEGDKIIGGGIIKTQNRR